MSWVAALLGGLAGGAGSVVHDIDVETKKRNEMELDEHKAEIQRKRDEYLSKQRTAEYETNLRTTQRIQDEENEKDAAVFRGLPRRVGVAPTYTDQMGNQSEGLVAGAQTAPAKPETDYEYARRVHEEAIKSGRKGAIAAAEKSETRALAKEELERREASDEMRHRESVRRTDTQHADNMKRLDASERGAQRRHEEAMGKSERGNSAALDKRWDDAEKDLTGNMVRADPMGGKDMPDHASRAAAMSAMRRLRDEVPTISPGYAANVVGNFVQEGKARLAAPPPAGMPPPTQEMKDALLSKYVMEQVNVAITGKPAEKKGGESKAAAPAKKSEEPAPRALVETAQGSPKKSDREIAAQYTKFGRLTPMEAVEAGARLGIPGAVEEKRRRDEALQRSEESRIPGVSE